MGRTSPRRPESVASGVRTRRRGRLTGEAQREPGLDEALPEPMSRRVPDDGAGTPAVRAAADDDGGDLVALVRRAQRKDAEAFTQLIRRYERVALSVAHAAIGGTIDVGGTGAGDVVQEAFLRAWQRLPELKEPARFGPWLCGVVRNLAIDARRRLGVRKLHVQRGGESGDDGPAPQAQIADDRAAGPHEQLHRQERDALLAEAIESLDEVSRTAVVLRYYENLSSKQIGELLALNATAVDMRLSRARQLLRARLQANEAFTDDE